MIEYQCLQCAMPVFEGLLPEPHNDIILSLLFTLAEWHTLAKLRLHTSSSLTWLQQTTGTLGAQIRYFKKHTCDAFATHELPNEAAAHGRRAARKQPGVAGTNTPARPVAATL